MTSKALLAATALVAISLSLPATAAELTEDGWRPSIVSRRTRRPAFRAPTKTASSSRSVVPAARAAWYARRTCPRISCSPRICESSPAATLYRCRTAAEPSSRVTA